MALPFRALRYPNYRWYWISGLGQTAAQGIKQLALAWLVLDLTGSVGQLGIVIFMQGLPMAAVSLYGGVLADRHDRRMLLIYSQALTMVNIFILAALTIAGSVELWHVYVSSVILGTTQALSSPARQAFIRSLVSQEEMMNAVALNAMLQHASRIVWPSVAGGLISWLGVGPTLVFNGACLIVGIGALFLIRGVKEEEATPQQTSSLSQMADGLRYTWSTPITRMVMTMAMGVGLFGLAFSSLAPGFARHDLGFNAAQTGLFLMVSGIGALVASTVLLAWDVKNKTALFLGGCFLFAIGLMGVAASQWHVMAFFFIAIFGLGHVTLSVAANTIFQTAVPSHLLGRVVSLWFFAGGLGSMSALPIGLLGDAFGLRWSLGGAASIFLAMTLWMAVVQPRFRPKPAEDVAGKSP